MQILRACGGWGRYVAGLGLTLLFGCATTTVPNKATDPKTAASAAPVQPWPKDAIFQGYPVIHCSSDANPAAFLADLQKHGASETTAKEQYQNTRDTVLSTLNFFLATGRWTRGQAQIAPTRAAPRVGTAAECRMFELALADEVSVRLPRSVSGAPYIAPIAMVGYDYEQPATPGGPATVAVRVAALLARGDGHVLRTISTVARADYAATSPSFRERSSLEIAQELTEQIAKSLASSLMQAPAAAPAVSPAKAASQP